MRHARTVLATLSLLFLLSAGSVAAQEAPKNERDRIERRNNEGSRRINQERDRQERERKGQEGRRHERGERPRTLHHGNLGPLFRGITLTDEQERQVISLRDSWRQTWHGREPASSEREAILSRIEQILTPQQKQQLRQNVARLMRQREATVADDPSGGIEGIRRK